MKLIDTHSHIYDEVFDQDRSETIYRAVREGVEKIYLPAIDSGSHTALLNTCTENPDICFPMMGLHPTSVNDNPDYLSEQELVTGYISGNLAVPAGLRFVAVGEIGLDLYWSKDSLTQQTEVFVKQIELALEFGLPVVIHTREAWPEMIDILSRYRDSGLKGFMHSFSGTIDDYSEIKRFGDFAFGIGGVVTYKNSGIAAIITEMDIHDIVLETDAPYLTPVPHRGKRNESSYLPLICRRVAEIIGRTEDEVADITTANTERIFGRE